MITNAHLEVLLAESGEAQHLLEEPHGQRLARVKGQGHRGGHRGGAQQLHGLPGCRVRRELRQLALQAHSPTGG
eukprot:scaffold476531_cov21-Prasinocladus_malaysianus.AAC.1